MSASLYSRVLKALAEAGEPLTTREIFFRVSRRGETAHAVSKVLYNLKDASRVSSAKTPELGHRALWWFLPKRTNEARRTESQSTAFRYTATGALAIVASGKTMVIPARVVPALRAFLRAPEANRAVRKARLRGALWHRSRARPT